MTERNGVGMNKPLDQIRRIIDSPDTLPEVVIVLGYLWLSIATGELGDPA